MTLPGETHQERTSSLYLASMSPRRAQLLRDHGYAFTVVRPTVEEPVEAAPNVPSAQHTEALSYFKARSVAPEISDGLIVAADTVAAVRSRVFGKPVSREDAGNILRALAGTTHEVITGVTLLDAATLRRDIRHAVTTITMRPLSDQEIESYLDTGEWVGKAGAYGIQDHGDRFVESTEGSFTNVVGLPMELLACMMKDWFATTGLTDAPGAVRACPARRDTDVRAG